jgi:hypothetical protein
MWGLFSKPPGGSKVAKISKNTKKVNPQSKDKAKKILSRVPEEKVFWCNDGQVFSDLEDLAEGLDRMSDITFAYHCNDSKNDFSTWIQDVIGDGDLAQDLLASKSRQQANQQVNLRYSDLTRLEG